MNALSFMLFFAAPQGIGGGPRIYVSSATALQTIMTPLAVVDKAPLENVEVYFQLAAGIGTDTIIGMPVFSSDPPDLLFTAVSVMDSAQTATALVGGGKAGITYVVSVLCTLASGQTVQRSIDLPVVTPLTRATPITPIVSRPIVKL